MIGNRADRAWDGLNINKSYCFVDKGIRTLTLTLTKTKQLETAAQQRQNHESAAQALFIKARHCAEDGRINEAGSLILQALGHERRAGSAGPQVLQLVKSRS